MFLTSSLLHLSRRRLPRRGLDAASSAFPAARGVAGEPDRNDQRRALEDRLDEERIAELLQAGDADRQHQHGDDGAPGVDPAGPDGGRAEQRADEGGQQELRPDRALRHLQPRGEDDAGEPDDQPAADEGCP